MIAFVRPYESRDRAPVLQIAADTGFFGAPVEAFLWFISVVRHSPGEYEDRLFSTEFLGGRLLFLAMIFASVAAVGASSRASEPHPDSSLTPTFARSAARRPTN